MRSGNDQLIEQLFLTGFGLEGGEKPGTLCSGDSEKDKTTKWRDQTTTSKWFTSCN